MKADELDRLAERWAVVLRAEGMSPNTVRVYAASVRGLAAWQRASSCSGLNREIVSAFIASILDRGAARTTAALRGKALRAFAGWLATEHHTDGNVLAGLKIPRASERIVPRLTDAELDKLIGVCAADGSPTGCRDQALVRLMAETGARAEEMLRMDLPADLDLASQLAYYRKTKGNRERAAPFSDVTAGCICRYLQVRRQLGFPDSGPLWLSARGTRLSYDGLYTGLIRRAKAAGITDFHPHRLRHTAAARLLAAGCREGTVMALLGWNSREMLDRYVRDVRADMAISEARRLFAESA